MLSLIIQHYRPWIQRKGMQFLVNDKLIYELNWHLWAIIKAFQFCIILSEYVCQKHLDLNPLGDKTMQNLARKNLIKVVTKSACDFLRETRVKFTVIIFNVLLHYKSHLAFYKNILYFRNKIVKHQNRRRQQSRKRRAKRRRMYTGSLWIPKMIYFRTRILSL